MLITGVTILLVVAFILFLAVAFNVPSRINLIGLAFAFVMLAELIKLGVLK